MTQQAYQIGILLALQNAGLTKTAGAQATIRGIAAALGVPAESLVRNGMLMGIGGLSGAGMGAIVEGSKPFGDPWAGAGKGALIGAGGMGAGLLGEAGVKKLYNTFGPRQLNELLGRSHSADADSLGFWGGFVPGSFAGTYAGHKILDD